MPTIFKYLEKLCDSCKMVDLHWMHVSLKMIYITSACFLNSS